MSAPTRVDAWPSRQEGSMDSFDDWDILSPPSAPHSDDERDTVVVQHGAKDNNNNFGDVLEPRRASSVAAKPGHPHRIFRRIFRPRRLQLRRRRRRRVRRPRRGSHLEVPAQALSSYSDAQQRLRNDMAAEPAGVDQWLRLAEESLTAGASRAASDLVALLAVVKRGSSAKPNLPVEDVGTCTSTGGENLADSSAVDIFTREVSSSVDDDDWRSLVRSLGPARFFLPLGIVLVTVCVVLVCVVSGGSVVSDARSDAVVVAAAAAGSRGSCQVPTSSFDAGSIDHRLHGPHIGDCPAYADDHTRVHGPSNSRELPTREDSLTEDVSRLTAENDRLRRRARGRHRRTHLRTGPRDPRTGRRRSRRRRAQAPNGHPSRGERGVEAQFRKLVRRLPTSPGGLPGGCAVDARDRNQGVGSRGDWNCHAIRRRRVDGCT